MTIRNSRLMREATQRARLQTTVRIDHAESDDEDPTVHAQTEAIVNAKRERTTISLTISVRMMNLSRATTKINVHVDQGDQDIITDVRVQATQAVRTKTTAKTWMATLNLRTVVVTELEHTDQE